MQWQLSEEQEAYRDSFGDWLASIAPADTVRGWLDSGDSASFADRFQADGWSGVGVSEDLGGQGGGLIELALTAEGLGSAAAPSATWLAGVLAAPALRNRQADAAAAFSGEPVAWLVPAGARPGAGHSLELDEFGQIHGAVPRVLGATGARRFVVPVSAGPDGATLRLVDAGDVDREPRRLLDRSRSVADVRLAAATSTALEPVADTALADLAARAAVLVAADTLGVMQRMLDLSVEYSKQRRQFGVPIGSFQAVKHAAATMLVDIEAARSAVYYAAATVDARDPMCGLHAAAVKAQVTASGVRAADTALMLHGAIGYTWEHDLHLFYKRAKLNQHLFGAPSSWNELIADGLELTPA